MPTLAQVIERNRQASADPYLFLAELGLPNGTTIRLARDTRSLAWPSTGAARGVLRSPGDVVDYTHAALGTLVVAIDSGTDAGTIELQRLDGASWVTVGIFSGVETLEIANQPAGAFRLIAMPGFAGECPVLVADDTAKVWQAFNFDLDEYKEGEGARRASVRLRVSNASGLALDWMEQLEDWRKANGREPVRVRLICVNAALLDDPTPVAAYNFVDLSIACPAPMDWVYIEIGTPNVWAKTVPARRILRDYCTWRRVDECPHVATCNHTLTRCREIAATIDPGRNEKFGGVPFVGKGAHYA